MDGQACKFREFHSKAKQASLIYGVPEHRVQQLVKMYRDTVP